MLMIALLQIQNPVTRPGVGTFTSHSIEIIVICLIMFLLGWFLHHFIHCVKHQAHVRALEKQLKNAHTRVNDLEGDLESCNAAIIKVKGENAAISAELSRMEKEGIGIPDEHRDRFVEVQLAEPEVAIAPEPQGVDDFLIAGLAADIAGSGLIGFDADTAQSVFGKKVQEDDLQIIEGIGPQTAKLLQNYSIHTWRQLGSTSVPQIQNILDHAGEKFNILNPSSWPKQARMAADGEWSKLHDYQEYLVGGTQWTATESKATTDTTDPSTSGHDDLTVIDGIGAKIQALLYHHGIVQWSILAETDVSRLKEILHVAGERYRKHDPSTWPRQARMATDNKWDELKDYQADLDSKRGTT